MNNPPISSRESERMRRQQGGHDLLFWSFILLGFAAVAAVGGIACLNASLVTCETLHVTDPSGRKITVPKGTPASAFEREFGANYELGIEQTKPVGPLSIVGWSGLILALPLLILGSVSGLRGLYVSYVFRETDA